MTADPPAPTGRVWSVDTSSLFGWVFPWDGDQPLFLVMPDSPHRYLAVFPDERALHAFLDPLGFGYSGMKWIRNPAAFVDSLADHPDICVIANLRWTEERRLRFTQLHAMSAGTVPNLGKPGSA